jgi:pantothenate kinase
MTSPQSKADTQSEITALAQELVQRVIALRPGQRYILGITGYPGAGKSTVSEWIVDAVNQQLRKHAAGGDMEAMLVPMDGYHLSNERLTELNLLPLKGIPDTFDAEAFVDLLRRLRTVTGENVYAPLFDRSIEASIQDAIAIKPQHKLCVVEGNYLLLETKPWDQCRQYLDEAWFLDVDIDTILPRLHERHLKGGRTPEAAKTKMESTDLPNARLIETTRKFAHKLINLQS